MKASAPEPTRIVESRIDSLCSCVCRYQLSEPGFALLDLGSCLDSKTLRRSMMEVKNHLDEFHRLHTTRSLDYFWVGRFDQQTTTKYHRDNAPDESVLMLGYEPTKVRSRLSIADHSRAAADRGLTSREYLKRCNPMFAQGEQELQPYVINIESYHPDHFQILLINNSETDALGQSKRLLGVLHKAEIVEFMPREHRIINSVMLAGVSEPGSVSVSDKELQVFLETEQVSQKNY